MAWIPSLDNLAQRSGSTPFWSAIEPIYDNACHLSPLPRWNWERLNTDYIAERKFDDSCNLREMHSRLPNEFRSLRLGPTEIELIDFMINYSEDRVLNLEGPRGAGKTSLLHYVESAMISTGVLWFPVLLIINCLKAERGMSKEDLINLLHQELKITGSKIGKPLGLALRRASDQIAKNKTFQGVRDAFRSMSVSLSKHEFNRIIVVFDNLDQNQLTSVHYGLELAKEIFVASNVAAIVSLRPGCLGGLYSQGSAREFFRRQIIVHAPKTEAWVAAIANRLKRQAERRYSAGRPPVRAYNKKMGADRIHAAMEKFISLLRRRSPEGNVIKILDAAAADDVRHLLLLIKRILRHRSLPGEWMLGLSDDDTFHPLVSLFEGDKRIFCGDKVVPNLLCFQSPEGGHDFLIAHRILRLLDSRQEPFPTVRLIHLLSFMGHPEKSTRYCLKYLHQTLLIRSTNAEILNVEEQLPDAFFLTESGRLYLHSLLTNTDYLAAAVLDVPLKHEKARSVLRSQSLTIGFLAKLPSLFEYAEDIRGLEEAQVERIISASPSTDRIFVLSILRKGGLLCSDLCDALYYAYEKAHFSPNIPLYEYAVKMQDDIARMKSWVETTDKRLTKVMLSGLRARHLRPRTVRLDNQADIVFQPSGPNLTVEASIRFPTPCCSALVSLSGSVDRKDIAQAVFAISGDRQPKFSLQTYFREVVGGAHSYFENIRVQAIADVSTFGSRLGLLTTDTQDGKSFHVHLHIFSPNCSELQSMDIGFDVPITDVKTLARVS